MTGLNKHQPRPCSQIVQGQAWSLSGWPEHPTQAQKRVRGPVQPPCFHSAVIPKSNSRFGEINGACRRHIFPFTGQAPGRLEPIWTRVAFCSSTILSGKQGYCLCKTKTRSSWLQSWLGTWEGPACLSLVYSLPFPFFPSHFLPLFLNHSFIHPFSNSSLFSPLGAENA